MSGANPVETKAEAPKAAEPTTALSEPTAPTPPPSAARAGWWAGLGGKKQIGLMVGGSVLALAGAGYGYKHLNPSPPRAVAQAEPESPALPKPAEPAKIPFGTTDLTDVKPPAPAPAPAPKIRPVRGEDPDLTLPDIPVPTARPTPPPIPTVDLEPPLIRPATPTIEPPTIAVPDIQAPPIPTTNRTKPGADADPMKPAPIPMREPPLPDIEVPTVAPAPVPEIKVPTPDIEVPTITIPTTKPAKKDEPKPMAGDLDFKAPDPILRPAPLPADVTDKKEKPTAKDPGLVIPSGGQDVVAPPPAPMVPAVPTIDVPPPLPPTAGPKPGDPPIPKIDLDIPAPPPPAPMTPTISNPMVPAVPAVPTIDVVPPMKDKPAPMPPVPPTIGVPMIPPPGIDNPPAPPPMPEAKKDMYDEDWHPQRDGDTYVLISKEYYKTADYAQALEAYNKDRHKPGERIIRVPPTWVLEEQFPNLVGKADRADKTEAADPKATGVKFEPATPTGAGRLAPPPAATGTDEYKVTAEAGETIREIARKALGDPNGWKKLWDLNPGLDPTQPIPAGTTLRLPR